MIEVERELWRLRGPTLLFQSSHPEWVGQNHFQLAFELSPRIEIPQPFCASCASAQSHTQWKNAFWCSKGTACVSVCATGPSPAAGHHWKSLGLSSLHPPFKYLYTLITPPWAFTSQAEECQLSQPFLIGEVLQTLITSVSLHWTFSIMSVTCIGHPKLDPTLQVWPHHGWPEGKDHLPWLAGNTLCKTA